MSKVLGKYVIIDRADVGKTTEDLLRDLLYESTGARIPGDKIVYGKPRELKQRPDHKYDPNTFIPVVVDIVYDTRFRSAGDGFMYRRRSIIEHCAGVDFTSIAPEFFPFRISDIIDKINAQLEYPITMENLVEFEYTTADQWINGVTLKARDESYLWTDGQKVMIDTTAINHQNLLTNHVLDGFNSYQPATGPFLIGGFLEYREPCTKPDCPVCTTTGKIMPTTPEHLVEYVNFINRDTNTAFRDVPTPVNLLMVAPGNVLKIAKPNQCKQPIIMPLNLIDERPTPIVDNVESPYSASIAQTSDCQEVELSNYAPSQQPPPIMDCTDMSPYATAPANPDAFPLPQDNGGGSTVIPGCGNSAYINTSAVDGYLYGGYKPKPRPANDCGC